MGPAGISGHQVVVGTYVEGDGTNQLTAFAVCPAGKKPLSGGFDAQLGSMRLNVRESHAASYPPGIHAQFPTGAEVWQVSAAVDLNGSPASTGWSLRAWATCAFVS